VNLKKGVFFLYMRKVLEEVGGDIGLKKYQLGED
jgi:hypothetical protein